MEVTTPVASQPWDNFDPTRIFQVVELALVPTLHGAAGTLTCGLVAGGLLLRGVRSAR